MVGKPKEKKETNEIGWVLHLGEGAVKEEKFLYIRKTPHGQELGGGWSFRTSKGNRATSSWKAKQREFTTEFVAKQHFPAETWLTLMPTAVSGGWVLRLPGRAPVLTALKIF